MSRTPRKMMDPKSLLSLSFDFLPPSDNSRERWLTPEVKQFYDDFAWIVKTLQPKPLPQKTYYALKMACAWKSMHRRDGSNLFKCMQDALQKTGLIDDDMYLYSEFVCGFYPPTQKLLFGRTFPEGKTWITLNPISTTHSSDTAKTLRTWD